MAEPQTYDVLIIGGGLAGLSLAIMLSKQNYNVLVIEKETYPRHKVCGEYISMQSKPFLERLGLNIGALELPVMNRLHVSDAKGNEVITKMRYGGFGISRYKLDAALVAIAVQSGTTLITKTKVDSVAFYDDVFSVKAGAQTYNAKVVLGTWGKRSNMDIKCQRDFTKEKNATLNNYVGIKYHIKGSWKKDVIGLHNFMGGYCGISAIEEDKYCLCYLTTADALRNNNNSVEEMEVNLLMRNKWLDEIFSSAEFLYESPMAISQISFEKKEQVLDHVLLLGDAAGMITPLCGNGMTMAFHSASIIAPLVQEFLQNKIGRSSMEKSYAAQWQQAFGNRTALGRLVQGSFGKERTTAMFLKTIKYFPPVQRFIINRISGAHF